MIFRDETSGRDLRLSQPEARQSLLLYESVVKDRQGRIVFISGEEGIGKSDVLQVLADAFNKAQPQPRIIAGRFREGHYIPWNIGKERPFPVNEALSLAGRGLTFSALTQFLPPNIKFAVELVGQSLQILGASRQFSSKHKESHRQDFSRSDFKQLIPDASQARPLIYLLDDLHKATPEWNTLFLEIATEIASNVPVLIFLTLDGPEELGDHAEGESNMLYLARELVKRELADWWLVKPVSREDVSAWLGATVPGMVDHLRGVTGGNTRLLIDLWKDWQYRNVVRFSEEENRWMWSSSRSPSVDLFKDVLEERVKRLLKTAGWDESKDLELYEETRILLACAALEGQVFTAEAIARILDQDVDELIDFLDDVLVQSDERPHGILAEYESVTIEDSSEDSRTLWRYSFVSPLYVAAAREFRSREERANLALALAHSLIESYSPEERQIAPNLAWLFRTGGGQESAARFQRMADYARMRDSLHQHALYLLSLNKDGWDEWACREAAWLFIEAAEKMINAYPHKETLMFFEEAHKMALRGGLRYEQAKSVYFCGFLLFSLGTPVRAIEKTQNALMLFQKLNNRDGEAGSLHQLGMIEHSLSNYESAREYTQQSLVISEEIGDRRGQAANLNLLKLIEEAASGNKTEGEPEVENAPPEDDFQRGSRFE